MKFPKLLVYSSISVIALIAIACSDFIDVNKDPNNPEIVPEGLQLSALLSNFSYEVLGNEPARTTTEWVQQLAWNGAVPSEDNYDILAADVNNLWNFSYIDVMNNAVTLDSLASQNGNYAYSGIAKIITAWNLSIVTDLWNDVPYSEAFNPSNTSPSYDSQESIYNAIFKKLDAAIADFDRASPISPSSDDLLYGGDMDKWKRLAFTLKARLQLHLTNAPGHDAIEQARATLNTVENGFTSNDDDADFTYYDQLGQENPYYQFAIDSKWDTRNQLSQHYVELLKSLNDPRLSIQARPAGAIDNNGIVADFDDSNSEYIGHPNGEEGEATVSISSIGIYYSAPDASLNWLSYAEVKFIEAEAVYRIEGAGTAQSVYEDAIMASMNKLGVSSTDANAYIASLPLLSATADPLEAIITQKYIANYLHFEPYNDWRRTGYPNLNPVTNNPFTPSGVIPVRFMYPVVELNNNVQSVDNTGIPRSYPALEIPVWWDTN